MLSIIATPIGNLGDITLRSIETLKKCDAIVCEDTRVTGSLLKKLEIPKKELISMHSYSNPEKADRIVERLSKGEHVVLVSDAGTPGISDPGYAVVSRVRQTDIPIEVLPGPSAFLAALSGSGLPINQFVYLGFLPTKKGRQTALKSIHEEKRTVVFYESVHRIEKALNELHDVLSDQPNRNIVIGRELTKLHEEIIHTTAEELLDIVKTLTQKGEFVVVVGAQEK